MKRIMTCASAIFIAALASLKQYKVVSFMLVLDEQNSKNICHLFSLVLLSIEVVVNSGK
jgi:hypothetical protein